MQLPFPPILAALVGLVAAAVFMGAFIHWIALLHASLSKHGGDFLGPPTRRQDLGAGDDQVAEFVDLRASSRV
jgi:hypothetical protein